MTIKAKLTQEMQERGLELVAPEHGKAVPKVAEDVNRRRRRRSFLRGLADLLEKFEDVAPTEGALVLDGGQWTIPGGIKRGEG